MDTDAIRIIVVEPIELLRSGLMSVLGEAGYSNCAGYASFEEMEADIDPGASNTMFLVNLGDDNEVVKRHVGTLKTQHPTSRIVLLSNKYGRGHMRSAINAGATGYLLTTSNSEKLAKSLEVILLGQPIVPKEALDLVANYEAGGLSDARSSEGPAASMPAELLSERELLVLRCLRSAMSNKLIAREFNISEASVKVHVKSILRKINIRNRTEAAIWALDQGLEAYSPAIRLGKGQIRENDDTGGQPPDRPAVSRKKNDGG